MGFGFDTTFESANKPALFLGFHRNSVASFIKQFLVKSIDRIYIMAAQTMGVEWEKSFQEVGFPGCTAKRFH